VPALPDDPALPALPDEPALPGAPAAPVVVPAAPAVAPAAPVVDPALPPLPPPPVAPALPGGAALPPAPVAPAVPACPLPAWLPPEPGAPPPTSVAHASSGRASPSQSQERGARPVIAGRSVRRPVPRFSTGGKRFPRGAVLDAFAL
jgi:hypothetical protein